MARDGEVLCLVVIMTSVLGLPQSIEIDRRPDKKFRQGFIGTPAAAAGIENKHHVPLLARSVRVA